VDDLLVWTGILDKMNDNQKQQVPFNTILFSDERILTEHEKQTVLEYVILTLLSKIPWINLFRNKTSSDNITHQASNRDQSVDFCK
jgi:hypothetical protein